MACYKYINSRELPYHPFANHPFLRCNTFLSSDSVRVRGLWAGAGQARERGGWAGGCVCSENGGWLQNGASSKTAVCCRPLGVSRFPMSAVLRKWSYRFFSVIFLVIDLGVPGGKSISHVRFSP